MARRKGQRPQANSTSSALPHVGVVGLGNMGAALADCLIAAGYPVTVWNRSPAKAERFRGVAAAIAKSAVETAAAAEVLVVCLFDEAATREAVLTEEMGAALSGRTLVQLSDVDDVELAAWAERHGVVVMKGRIFVYPDDMRAMNGTVVYGGPRSLYEALEPVLTAMGGQPMWVGEETGAGNDVDAAYCCFLYPVLVGFLHGAAACHRAGVDIESFAEKVIVPLMQGPALAGMIENLARASSRRRYDHDVQATVETWRHDLEVARARLAELGVSTELLEAAEAQMAAAAERGHGRQDLASIFEVLVENADRREG